MPPATHHVPCSLPPAPCRWVEQDPLAIWRSVQEAVQAAMQSATQQHGPLNVLAVGITNQLAPEHLQIAANNPKALADRIDHAGAIFLGHYSPVALGDYAAGPSHVLPTGGSARWASGLTSNDFLKRTSIIHFEPAGLCEIAPEVLAMADYEGLTAHAESVRVRLAALADGQGVP